MDIILGTIFLAIGIMFVFIGWLMSAATALGNHQVVIGWASVLFMPLSILYCVLNWDKASYPGKMMFAGIGLIALGSAFFVYNFQ